MSDSNRKTTLDYLNDPRWLASAAFVVVVVAVLIGAGLWVAHRMDTTIHEINNYDIELQKKERLRQGH